ncbi:putative calcium-binding protein CML19 isoform X1 [Cucurbita pepo subsp. pepo]|uniref:putative calcium-binding protein CML19 isoform X1 n=1 Tax=Cucurbita pepo subsp. pepo TaxID=3664 RepID=UPI000C9DA5BC|nr:putative calcium-binding protein CML19 isoform X1 [Cucurbita pepo subsp. pepo]
MVGHLLHDLTASAIFIPQLIRRSNHGTRIPFHIIADPFCCNPQFFIPKSLSSFGSRMMDKMALYEKVFKQVDGDGDGKLSPLELQRCMAGVGGSLTLEEAEMVVENLDTDGDGLMGWGEFVAFVEGVGEEEKVSDLKEAFRMYEMDGCGFITTKSLKRMLSRLGESRSIEECNKMIAKFDLNSDGVLNFDEFMFMMS